jgi:hypothetical protein
LNPAAAAPAQELVALGLEALFEQRAHRRQDVQPLGVVLEQERDAEHRERAVDRRQPGQHQEVALQLIDARPHHPQRRFLAALRAARVHRQLHPARRLGLPLGAHVEQRLVPRRVDRRLRGELDGGGLGRRRRGERQRQHQSTNDESTEHVTSSYRADWLLGNELLVDPVQQ